MFYFTRKMLHSQENPSYDATNSYVSHLVPNRTNILGASDAATLQMSSSHLGRSFLAVTAIGALSAVLGVVAADILRVLVAAKRVQSLFSALVRGRCVKIGALIYADGEQG